jgi:hypothetical protein
MDVFSLFETTPYTFQVLGQGGIYGNKVLETHNAEGIFKLRRGITQGRDMQNATSTATLHIRSTESFLEGLSDLAGNGIQYKGQNYRIVGVTDGTNFDNNVLEHITLTLQVEASV